jgi:hypothetical protein
MFHSAKVLIWEGSSSRSSSTSQEAKTVHEEEKMIVHWMDRHIWLVG